MNYQINEKPPLKYLIYFCDSDKVGNFCYNLNSIVILTPFKVSKKNYSIL